MRTQWNRRNFLKATGYTAGLCLAGWSTGGNSGPTAATAAPAAGTGTAVPKLDDTLLIHMYGDKAQDIFIESVARPFGEKYGVKIVAGSVASQNEMLAKIKATPGEFDIFRCSDFAVFQGTNEGLLEAIDLGNVPNFKNLDKKFQKVPSDPGNDIHTIPFQPGCYVMVKVDEKMPVAFDSYAPVYDPKYAGKISLRDYGGYRVLQTALYLGYDVNNLTAEQEKKVFDTMREQRKLVKAYWKNEAEARTLLKNRDAWSLDYWLDATLKNQKELGISWWIPKEGTPGWVEGLSIAKGSKHKKTAEALINYFLQPDVFMRFAKVSQIIPTLGASLWSLEQHKKDAPDLAPLISLIRERSIQLNLTVWARKQKDWTEMYEQIKLGG